VLSSAAEPAENCGVYKYLQTLQAEWQIYPWSLPQLLHPETSGYWEDIYRIMKKVQVYLKTADEKMINAFHFLYFLVSKKDKML
jgi:hypothetical protein